AERGDSSVSPRLAATIAKHVPSVRAGAPIVAAHEAVLSRQAVLLASRDSAPAPATDLSEDQARRLCDQIRKGLGELSLLLVRAHKGRAWVALGYDSWERFVRTEFALSRSRSYQLLDHGVTITALRDAAGMDGYPVISEGLARRIKPRLGELVAE